VQGLLDRAASEFRSALRYDSDFAMAYDNLGLVLGQQGNADDAVIAFKAAIRHKLDSAGVYLHLGIGLEMQGQSRDAIAAYRAALARHPDWPEAANKLAWLLATHPQAELREPSEAVRLAELACAPWAQPLPEYFNTLAAAYAAAGRFTDAMQAAQRGIDGARAAGKPVLADEMAQHLHQYELGQPYRQPAPDA
jgi:spermidine synthase